MYESNTKRENRMSGRACGPRNEGVTGGWREIPL